MHPSNQGDPNASIPTVQPMIARPMFAPLVPETSVLFVSQASVSTEGGVPGPVPSYGLRKRVEPVRGCRSVSKRDMRFNDAMPTMRVDPERYTVHADGQVCDAEPADLLPLAQGWFAY